MCVLIFYTKYTETLLILRRIQLDMVRSVCCVSCKVPVTLVGFNETRNLDRFFKNTRMSKVMKVSQLGADLFLVNGQTDRQSRQRSAFRRFAKEQENVHVTERPWRNESCP